MTAKTLWLVGCGNMGGAMLRRWIETGLDPKSVTVIDPALPKLTPGVRVVAAPDNHAPPPSILILGVKPQLLSQVAPVIAPCLDKNTLIISIMAGVEIATLSAQFTLFQAIIRAMPNMPVAHGQGVVALFGANQGDPLRTQMDALMASFGVIEWLDDETLFDAVIAVSGSGPAFVYRFIAAMAHAGGMLGLPAEQAIRMAAATVAGAGQIALISSDDPAELAKRVASPGGTTERGLAVLDADQAFTTLITQTLKATAARSAELSKLSAHSFPEAP